MAAWRLRQNDPSKAAGSDGAKFMALSDVFGSSEGGRCAAVDVGMSSEFTSQSSE